MFRPASTARGLLLISALLISLTTFAKTSLEELQVDYQTTPLGIDISTPHFSWRMASDVSTRGLFQEAYQIMVRDESDQVVWATDKVESGLSLSIPYAGKSLEATTRYTWTVTVWTNTGEKASASSWFETGLMNPDPNLSAWDGATWIGGGDEDMVLHSHYLSVFKVEYTLQLDSSSTKAAFVLGANDERNMDKNLNLEGMEVGEDESYMAVEVDVSPIRQGQNATLNIFRVGYAQEDRMDHPLHSFEIPGNLIDSVNMHAPHTVFIEVVFGMMEVYIDGHDDAFKITENPAGGFGSRGVAVNPYGYGADFIAFPLLADIGFKLEPGQKATFSDLKVRHYRQPSNVLFAKETAEMEGGSEGLLETFDPSQNAAPMLRTEFAAENKSIRKARIYATARGIYELHLNGERVGQDFFNPGLTQYNKTHMYQTFDVTDMIESGGENVLGAWMSEGWWSGNITFRGENWNFFGDRQSLLAKLVITYEDGSETTVVTHPDSWQLYTDGPIRYGSFFQGEVYDANKEAAIDGWATVDYDATDWKSVVEVPLAGTALTGTFRNFMGAPVSLDYSAQQIVGQVGEHVTHIETLTAQSVEEVRPGVFVYDMGQNMVGVPRLSILGGEKGQQIRMRFAEVRYPDLEEYAGNEGMVMLENIRAALAQDLYILKGGDEAIQPRFTFHGYRFIEITGIDEALPLDAVQGIVISSVSEISSRYETSNPLINRLWKNILWSLRANFLSIPTDTPARNERMGWNGDLNVFSRAATWMADANQFLKRHMIAMRDMQADNGRFSDVAPIGNGFGGTLWGSAGIVVPWEAYQQYGDTTLLADHYEAMKDYVNFLRDKENEAGVLIEGPLGDWLSPENSKNDNTMLWAAYQTYDLYIMAQVATILGKSEEAAGFQQRYEARRAFLNETYVDPETHQTVHSGVAAPGFGPPPANPPKAGDIMDTQASYAIPLGFDLFDEETQAVAIDHLATTITRPNVDDLGITRPPYSLMTGFIGTASMGDALSKNGRDDLAYLLLQSENYPSWLYPVKNGATTIWERLNSYTVEDGFGGNNSMNSFNHYSFGAIASWMYNYSLGIQRDLEHPGFKHFVLRPTPDPTGGMSFAKGYYDSMYGRIVSEWYEEEGGTRYVITVPPNTSATLYLPGESFADVRESGKKLRRAEGIEMGDAADGRLMMELESGSYEFWVRK